MGNQQALASSRLWDAVSGFMSVFSVMQRHLYYLHTSHIELLRELLSLQEEQFVLLRSMLEGSALSSNTARLMVDTLMDTSSILEVLVPFIAGPLHCWSPSLLVPFIAGPLHCWSPSLLVPFIAGPLHCWSPSHFPLQDIVSFFSIFVKLQDVAICDAFKVSW